MGKIVTFYSYKGGTGRSMALANMAWILASQGASVLVVDWDLEAPGLHRYFRPFLPDKDLTRVESQGVIDFAIEYVEQLITRGGEPRNETQAWLRSYADIGRWSQRLLWPSGLDALTDSGGFIDFVPAGRQGAQYAKRVNSFNWTEFYERYDGGAFIEAVRESMRRYDWVLVDSRTGVSDTSGICTVQLPDALVVCFTLNYQSISGASAVAQSAMASRRQDPLQIYPLPTRLDDDQESLLKAMMAYARAAFDEVVPPSLDRTKYWQEVGVPYFSRYAYSEKLAPFEDQVSLSTSTLPAMERLTSWVTQGAVSKLRPLPEDERVAALVEFERQPEAIVDPAASEEPDRAVRLNELLTRSPQLKALYEDVIGARAKWLNGRDSRDLLRQSVVDRMNRMSTLRAAMLEDPLFQEYWDQSVAGRSDTVAGKAIVLFSDGTGNSSAKLFKTNVWRMYEAVDLGPPAPGKRPQISYYDDGVGTSSFKPLAALGGAFGWGLKRNVLDIYRFACRNYREGDDIYAFGFSRGAFTARLVVALIASEGLVRSQDEAELDRKTLAAYRSFRRHFLPRRLAWPTKLARVIRRRVIGTLDGLRGLAPYDSSQNLRPKIRFIGVWDTVAAYGGPITEVTRAVDNWFFPLSMPDYHLHDNVLCARHALAIDDERDAFQPLLWDEVHEKTLQQEKKVDPNRLLQVWFTGMHSDVGGGYPDESLSYVSLLWMMEEAQRAGLRTLDVIKDRFVALASSFGPIHDSRAGIAAYYRYQPRKIAAWLDPADPATLSLRDPAIKDKSGKSCGLLRAVHVHESVINRIATGTDRYAPITLPGKFDIVPPQEHGENVPQADSETPTLDHGNGPAKPMLDRGLVAMLNNQALARARDAATEVVWNRVWWRRVTYFATLATTLLLVGLPIILNLLPDAPIFADGRTWIGGVIRLLTIVLPAFAGRWVEVYANNPFYFLLFALIILILLSIGKLMERRLRDQARHVWHQTLGGEAVESRISGLQKFRTSAGYQRFLRTFKWYVLPDWVITPLTVVVGVWVVFAAYVQAALPFLENGAALCKPSPVVTETLVNARRDFLPKAVCSDSFGLVEKGQRYVVTFDVLEAWHDATLPTSPEGLPAREFPWGSGYLAAPLKRVINAHYLQPLIEIRPTDEKGEPDGNIQIYPLPVQQVGDEETLFRAEFKAQRTGELFLFVNDAMLPFTGSRWGKYDYRYFYQFSGSDETKLGNRGSACVTIESADAGNRATSPAPGPICEKTAQRRSAAAAPLRAFSETRRDLLSASR